MSTLLQLNYALFQTINASAGTHPWLDLLMIFCANWLIFYFPLVLIIMWGRPLYWRKHPLQPGEADIIQERRAVVLWVGIACLVAYGVNLFIEQFVFEPRPFVSHHVHLLVTHVADSSFPSDHAAWAFAVVGMLLLQLLPACMMTWSKYSEGQYKSRLDLLMLPGVLTGIALVFACSVGLARVFVGVHYPGDIVGGAVDGLIAAAIATLLRQKLRQPTTAVLRLAHTLRLA